MADYTSQINSLIASVASRITGQSTVNSIDPLDVGGSITDLADLLLPILNTINNFDLLGGTLNPSVGQGDDDDIYIQGGTSLTFWKKVSGVWISKVSVPLGINFPDGNGTLQSSVNNLTVRVSQGSWWIGNIQYNKATQTEFTVPTQHATLDRIDAVFANNVGSGTLNYITGTPLVTPVEPTLTANNIVVTYIYVPSIASGQLPYISENNSGGGNSGVSGSIVYQDFTQDDLIDDTFGGYYLNFTLPSRQILISPIRMDKVSGTEFMAATYDVSGKIIGFLDNTQQLIRVFYTNT